MMSDESEPQTPTSLDNLVHAALDGDAREGITNLLKAIASITNSFGCVLWRATEGAVPPNKGELTMLAAYFPAEKSHFGIKTAPFKDSVAGSAATNERGWELDNNLAAHKNLNCDKPFFKKTEINRVVACRFKYLPRLKDEPRLGVVMIFRQKKDPEFFEHDAALLLQITGVLPYLYSFLWFAQRSRTNPPSCTQILKAGYPDYKGLPEQGFAQDRLCRGGNLPFHRNDDLS